MPKYKVYYQGWYIIEADSIDDAYGTDKDDAEVEFEQWENYGVDELEG